MVLKEFLSGFKLGQREFGNTIAMLVNSILLSVVYFFGIGIVSVLGKLFRKDFLEVKIEKNRDSYWENLNLTNRNLEDYYKQF